MTLVERIKETAKNKKGWNLKTTAEKSGIGINSIYKWKTQTPQTDKLVAVAKTLGVTVDYLLGKNKTPDWANEKDTRDLETFLERNLEGGMTYGGEDLTEEEKQQVKLAMTTIFWKRHKHD